MKAISDKAYAQSMSFDTPLESSAQIDASEPQPIHENQSQLPVAVPLLLTSKKKKVDLWHAADSRRNNWRRHLHAVSCL